MPIKTVNAKTLKSWIETGEAVVIDVREPIEYAEERITNATLLPLGEVTKAKLPPINGKKLVIHCRSGKRGTNACEKLLSEDPNLEIYNLEGGISAWKALGNETVNPEKSFLPLDRQVQLTIGLILLISSYLVYTCSIKWLLLIAMVGAGLTIAGLTSFCGLAIIIAKMPWNKNINNVTSCNIK